MSHIVLTDDQTRFLDSTSGPVEARDSGGRLRAIIQPLHPQEVEALTRMRQRRAADPAPTIPAERVQAMLLKFHEIESAGELTTERVQEVLRRVRAGEEP
jgi:hypothetical protein